MIEGEVGEASYSALPMLLLIGGNDTVPNSMWRVDGICLLISLLQRGNRRRQTSPPSSVYSQWVYAEFVGACAAVCRWITCSTYHFRSPFVCYHLRWWIKIYIIYSEANQRRCGIYSQYSNTDRIPPPTIQENDRQCITVFSASSTSSDIIVTVTVHSDFRTQSSVCDCTLCHPTCSCVSETEQRNSQCLPYYSVDFL